MCIRTGGFEFASQQVYTNFAVYAVEACQLLARQTFSFEFTLTRIFIQLFRTGSSKVANECQLSFGFLPAETQKLIRTASFLQKFKLLTIFSAFGSLYARKLLKRPHVRYGNEHSGRTLPPAWSQAPVSVTTSHQCYGSCTGCQSVSASCSRSRGSCISRLSDWFPRTSRTTVAFCRTLAVAHCGPTPMTCGSCLCHEHITNSVIGVSRPLVLDWGTTFHLDSGGRDLPWTLSDNI